MLASHSIAEAIEQQRLRWDGVLRGDALLGTLGGTILECTAALEPIDPLSTESLARLYGRRVQDWTRYVLKPGGFVLAQIRENLVLDSTLVGYIAGLSHVARFGLQVHLASPWVERNFGRRHGEGVLVLELTNAAPAPLLLTAGMPVAKIHLFDVGNVGADGDVGFYGRKNDIASAYPVEFGSFCVRKDGTP